jgi:hypothetical protein
VTGRLLLEKPVSRRLRYGDEATRSNQEIIIRNQEKILANQDQLARVFEIRMKS